MPTRYLKPGIRDSEAIDSLTPLAEVLFYRLLVTVDDFGRYDARPALIKSHCFPIRESITPKKCEELLYELQSHGLIDIYTIDGKPYLQMHKWDNKARASESKFPANDGACIQVHADVNEPPTLLPLTVTVTGTETKNRNRKQVDAGFAKFWDAYPKKVGKGDAEKSWSKLQQPAEALERILNALAWQRASEQWTKSSGQFIPNPATYLNQRRWEDERTTPNLPASISQRNADALRMLGFDDAQDLETIHE